MTEEEKKPEGEVKEEGVPAAAEGEKAPDEGDKAPEAPKEGEAAA